MIPDLTLPIEAEALIPHRLPVRIVDRLTTFRNREGTTEALMRPGLFVRDGGIMEPMAMVELVAQSFAAIKGYADLLEGHVPSKGFLVQVKRFAFFRDVRVGDSLTVAIRRVGETAEFAIGDGSVLCGAELVASGRVMVWVPDET
jgi:predicted hotdog family 3-hydroxylacyl-ACP dehydratase